VLLSDAKLDLAIDAIELVGKQITQIVTSALQPGHQPGHQPQHS